MSLLPRSQAADRRFFGVYEAIVESVEDPLHEGRVQLRFPWFDGQMVSDWCRVRQFYAGNGYGAFFVPEAGDEVLVAFIQGDMRVPVVLGGLYNGQDKPPTHRTDSKDQKLIRTKGKHEILLDDTGGEKRVRIKTDGGHQADLNDKDKTILLKTADGQNIKLEDQSEKVTVETGGNTVVLDGKTKSITIQTSGGQSITLEAGSIKLSAASIVLSGGSIKLSDAAAQSLVLGEALLLAFNTHTHNCTAPGTPSGPPVPPLTSAVLSQIAKTG